MKSKAYLHLSLAAALLTGASCRSPKESAPNTSWQETLRGSDKEFHSTGRNKYFVLEPGFQLTLEGEEDGGNTELIITVLNETKTVDGVETRVVEEHESRDGKVIEISRNYFAIGGNTQHVYYFGEDVDVYSKNGEVSHPGGWRAGVRGAKKGIMIPGHVAAGQKYYQENAPEVALDRAENISTSEKIETPAGAFKNCLKVKETTPLEAGTEYKIYAPGIGLVKEGGLKLVKFGFVTK
ncbi:MAG: hypothetical protein ABJC04_05400 [Verrucomicrobiota bacterium]